MRSPFLLIISLLVLIGGSPAAALAQGATPATGDGSPSLASSATEDRLDLAAMALTQADLPPGFVNVDEFYLLTAEGVAGFFLGQAVSPEEIAALDLTSMYFSAYAAVGDGTFLGITLSEFASPDDVQAGFDVLEDDTRVFEGIEVLSTQDLPGPAIGDAPSETTVGVTDLRAVGGPLVNVLDMTFRVDTILVSVRLETDVEAGAAGDMASPASATPVIDQAREQLVNEIATTLVERIEAVQAGEEVSGVDQSLPPLLLSTDQAWLLPGAVAEGYRDAPQILGTLGPATEFTEAFESGYGRTVAPGTAQDDLYPQPPFVTVGVSRFTAPEAAMSVLEVANEVPNAGPVGSPQIWEQVETAQVEGADASSTYRGAFHPGGPVDSARVAFVSGDAFVTVDVLGAASEQAALDAATDLAAQQAACLAAGTPCQDLSVPQALETGAEATPVAAMPVR